MRPGTSCFMHQLWEARLIPKGQDCHRHNTSIQTIIRSGHADNNQLNPVLMFRNQRMLESCSLTKHGRRFYFIFCIRQMVCLCAIFVTSRSQENPYNLWRNYAIKNKKICIITYASHLLKDYNYIFANCSFKSFSGCIYICNDFFQKDMQVKKSVLCIVFILWFCGVSASQVSQKYLTCDKSTKSFTFTATGKWNSSTHPLLVSEINLQVIWLLQIGPVFKTNSLWLTLNSLWRKFTPQGC